MATPEEIDVVVKMMPSLLDTMKDIATYLEKQDATFEPANLPKGQKITETQAPISGGKDPNGAPAPNPIAKAADTKEEEESEESESEEKFEEKDPSEKSDDVEELKSILKSIVDTLKAQQESIPALVKSELKKSLAPAVKSEADKMLRKMGFNPTRPDVQRIGYGLDTTSEVKKSEDIVKSDDTAKDGPDKEVADIHKAVEDLSKMSWTQLGAMREKEGLFNPFPRG
jgi:hypothetical protein